MSYIAAISISKKRGVKKNQTPLAILKENFGIIGDAHAGSGYRQISLLSYESIQQIEQTGMDVKPGDFAENVCTIGLDYKNIKIGTKLGIGAEVILQITQIGKTCHSPCRIYKHLGDCIMPREGLFATVIKGGTIKVSDSISIIQGAFSDLIFKR